MNKRIKELALQAGYTKDMFGVGHWDMPECQKFAELIVRECAELCDVNDKEQGNILREHFGVKL
jgi:hypothetical protein